MSKGNFYKPRYHIAYLSKTKVWPYKNSYLRNFYNIRSKRLKRFERLFCRCALVATNMKWTEARRFFVPFKKKSNSSRFVIPSKTRAKKRLYRNSFYMKKQFRSFYGKIKEQSFEQYFSINRSILSNRSNSFFYILESRLDRVFFRMRILPTIFACNQFIQHHGLIVNNQKEISPNYYVSIGDIISFPKKTWNIFYSDINYRIYYRRWGFYIMFRRIYNFFKKKKIIFSKNKRKYKSKSKLFSFFYKYKKIKKYIKIKKFKKSKYLFKSKLMFKNKNKIKKYKKKKKSIVIHNNFFWSKFSWNISQMLTHVENENKYKSDALIEKEKPIHLYNAWKRKKLYSIIKMKQLKWKRANSFMRYFEYKIFKQKIRHRKIVRIKPVHFYIPNYLYVDFRTLRAIKRNYPITTDIYYPFRGSISKISNFYHSSGY